MIFTPARPFDFGETVHVTAARGIRSRSGKSLPPVDFHFVVSRVDPKDQAARTPVMLFPDVPADYQRSYDQAVPIEAWPTSAIHCDSLPSEYPEITVLTSNNPEEGAIFLTPFTFADTNSRLLILDNLGMPLFYRKTTGTGPTSDFKVQPNGLLTYSKAPGAQFMAMDSNYTVVDSFRAGNGYSLDTHGFQLKANGHALLMIYDQQPVRMDTIVPGGRADAIAMGLVIQELDAARNVVFQWKSSDHFEITDVNSAEVSLTDSIIDYVHGNSVEWDFDGNILLSSRHLNEITKINRQTGDVMWRMGINARKNEFTFLNDIKGFSHQHDARRIQNGHITLFDNGNYLFPQYSRALEYQVDEANKTATLVWEGRMNPDIFGGFMGSTQRLAGGGTLIGWGGTFTPPAVTEIHADGYRSFELGLPPGTLSYRAFRFPWRTTRFLADVQSIDFGVVAVGASHSEPISVRNNTGSEITISCVVSTDPSFSAPGFSPVTLMPGASTSIDVAFTPSVGGETEGNIYVREVNDSLLVAQAIAVRGMGSTIVSAETPENFQFRLHANTPNPVNGETSIQFELARASHVSLAIYDIRGRKVATLVDEARPAGRYLETWSSVGLPNGLYFYRLRAGEFVDTKKLSVLE
jgi:hypothetical protein